MILLILLQLCIIILANNKIVINMLNLPFLPPTNIIVPHNKIKAIDWYDSISLKCVMGEKINLGNWWEWWKPYNCKCWPGFTSHLDWSNNGGKCGFMINEKRGISRSTRSITVPFIKQFILGNYKYYDNFGVKIKNCWPYKLNFRVLNNITYINIGVCNEDCCDLFNESEIYTVPFNKPIDPRN